MENSTSGMLGIKRMCITGDRLLRYSRGECPVFDTLDFETDKINSDLRFLFCWPL